MFKDLRQKAIKKTIKDISSSFSFDNLIIQAINNVDELNKIINILVKRLREWIGYYIPEIVNKTDDNESFVSLVLTHDKKQLFQKFDIKESMGADFSSKDLEAVLELAKQIKGLYELKLKIHNYLESLMKEKCPNLLHLVGVSIGAKLLEQAGSLKRLARMPSSTIQVLGAEKALFRHLKSGSKPPKHGFIINHPLVTKARQRDKGKVARTLADKISLVVKIDFFHGEFIADKIKKDLEKRFL